MLARLLKLALTLALLGAAAPAWAATKYVSASAGGGGDGSSGNPWTMAEANSNLTAGDVAILADGTYSTAINPTNSGSAGNYIKYLGDVADTTGEVLIPDIALTKDYISVAGVSSNNIEFGVGADYCSLSHISAREGGWQYATDDSALGNVIYRCNFYMNTITTYSQIRFSGKAGYGVFRRNRVTCPSVNGSGVRWVSGGDDLAKRWGRGTIDSNKFVATLTTTDVSGLYFFGLNNTSFKDNRIEITSNTNSTQLWGFAMRDSARFNTFRRDTIYLYGDADGDGGCAQFGPTVSGTYTGTCDYGKMDSCTIVQFDSDCDAGRWEGGSAAAPDDGWEFRHNVIVGGWDVRYGKDSTVVEHNTFYSPNGWAFSLYNKSGTDSWTNMVVRWNIFYRNSIADCGGASYSAPYETEDASTGYWDRNLAQAGTHSGTYDSNGRVANSNCSAGCCATMVWETVNDDSSSWKSPYFADSTSAATFNPRPLYGSWAIRGWADAGGYVGARQDSTGEVDGTPPTISLTRPDGGESWNEGQGQTITWTATDAVGVTEIRLWYTANNGTNWTSIATGEANDGAYLWTVPNVERESNQMRIRVWATDAAGNQASDSSSTAFTVLDSLRPNKVRNLWASRVEWTAVKLQWTGVANCTTTVLKYDTTPLTESGANNFRTHGTSVSTGTPSAAGVLDSATVTGLTPGTRYYFALRHIDNDGVSPETSLVSIGEVRTTRPAISKGLRATSTRHYPLLGMRPTAWWESDVSANWPRSEAGWPLYGDSAGVLDTDVLRDSMLNAIYGYDLTRTLMGYGTTKRARLGVSYEPTGLGIPDSAFKARVPSLISIAGHQSFAYAGYKQFGPTTDTTGFQPDDIWNWHEMNNWASRTQDTTGSYRSGTVVYPERLYLWSAGQNAGATAYTDTCTWGSWYLDDDGTCFGMGQNAVYRYNMLSRDTTTGDWDVLEHLADWYAYRALKHTQYASDPNKYYRDGYWNDYGAFNVDARFISGIDSVDINRSGLAGVVANYAHDFRERWVQMGQEFYARSAYYRDQHRDGWLMHHANIGSADVLVTSDWDVLDALELDYTGSKGTGGKFGLLSNIYGRRFAEAPTIEPSFATISAVRPTEGNSIVFFPWRIIDSCAAYQTGNYAQSAARGALGMAYGAMYDDFIPTFEFASETVGQMADPGVPDSCGAVGNVYLTPFYWDEPYVSVSSGAAVGWGAWGTGTGKGWLGSPIDDRFKWASTALADTNLLTVGTSYIDGSFRTLQGWRPTNGTSFPATSALGIVDTMRVDNGRHPRGTHGTADTIVRVRRATIDHTNFYDIGFRVNNGFGVELNPSLHHSIRWWCKADSPTFVTVYLRNQVTGNNSGQLNGPVVWVDTTWRQYEVQIGRKASGLEAAIDTACQVAFYLADTLGTVYFDDVELYNKPVGVMYRRFENGVVFINPDSGQVVGDSTATVNKWRMRGGQVINYASVFGDTATYDYRLIDGVNPNRKSLNNGRIFGYGTAALDTIPDAGAKFVIRAPNGYWNSAAPGGKRQGVGRIDRLIRGRGR